MEQNPYESPKEVNSPPTVKAGAALGGLLLLSIPAGCICGGITCWTSGVVGEMTVEKNGGPIDAGYIIGIPIGLIVRRTDPGVGGSALWKAERDPMKFSFRNRMFMTVVVPLVLG